MSKTERPKFDDKTFFLYSATITCIIVGVLFRYGKLILASDIVYNLLSDLFFLVGYYLFLIIAKRLKSKGIHGLTNIVWATFLLLQENSINSPHGLFWTVLIAVTMVILIYFLVDGIIRFIISLIEVIKDASKTEKRTIESVETSIAILTSILAIVISIIGLL